MPELSVRNHSHSSGKTLSQAARCGISGADVNAPGSSPNEVSKSSPPGFTVPGAILRGALGFAVVSVAGFAVWAFAGMWFHQHFGEAGLYTACAVVFLGLSGLVLSPLVRGPRSLVRFYKIFVPAFVVYAIAWCAVWFALRFGAGEWVASFAGSAGFVVTAGFGFRNFRGLLPACLVLFILHSAGYFLGDNLMLWLAGPDGARLLSGLSKPQISVTAKLGWGLLYGLGFGAGLGFTFFTFQNEPPQKDITPQVV